MIEEHPAMAFPPHGAVLWRFIDFTKFVSMLDSRRLHFAQLKLMEDTFEGAFTKPQVDRQRMLIRDNAPLQAAIQGDPYRQLGDFSRSHFYVSCWHMNPHESAAMWKLYLKTHDEGVAIRTTFRDMRNAFEQSRYIVHGGVVKYIDYTTEEFPENNLLYSIMHKRKSFEHEAEVRLIASTHSNGHTEPTDDEPDLVTGGSVLALPVNLSALVQKVYVSPQARDWFADLVGAVARKYDLNCPVVKSDLYCDPVW